MWDFMGRPALYFSLFCFEAFVKSCTTPFWYSWDISGITLLLWFWYWSLQVFQRPLFKTHVIVSASLNPSQRHVFHPGRIQSLFCLDSKHQEHTVANRNKQKQCSLPLVDMMCGRQWRHWGRIDVRAEDRPDVEDIVLVAKDARLAGGRPK